MKTLIIEDLKLKALDIIEYLNRCGIENITLKKARNAGLLELRNAAKEGCPYDLLVLDMYFPIYEDSAIDTGRDAGIDVLREIKRLGLEGLSVIMCSSADIKEKVQEFSNVVGVIQYNHSIDLTKEFEEIISQIKETENVLEA